MTKTKTTAATRIRNAQLANERYILKRLRRVGAYSPIIFTAPTANALKRLKDKGRIQMKKSVGYVSTKTADRQRARLVAKAQELYGAGLSFRKIDAKLFGGGNGTKSYRLVSL
jgi:hypothetical protein